MSSILIRCPGCGQQSHAQATFEPVVCVHCDKSFLLPRKLVMEATNTTEEEQKKVQIKRRLNDGFALLETPKTHPNYDESTREALALFTQLVKDDKTVSRAWFGLFCCLLNQGRKTFADKEKIPGTEYWFFDGVPAARPFVVEGYFHRVAVSIDGAVHSLLYDSTLQPGRKAHYYLHNAVENAKDEADKLELTKQMDLYFTSAVKEMAESANAYLAAQPKA